MRNPFAIAAAIAAVAAVLVPSLHFHLRGAAAEPPVPTDRQNASPISALAFSPDGSALVSNGPRSITIRSADGKTVVKQWDCPWPKITALRFDPTGRRLGVVGGTPGEHGEALVLAWPEGAPVFQARLAGDLAMGLDFSPDGRRMVVAGANHLALVWNLPADEPGGNTTPVTNPPPVFTLAGHAGPVLATAWDPADGLIATASADRSIKIWSTADGHLLRSFNQHTEPPNALAFRPRRPDSEPGTPSVCASGGDDRTVRIWQPGVGRMVRIVRNHGQSSILALAWAPDGASLFTSGSDGRLRRVDADSDAVLAEWPGHPDWILALTVSRDGSRLATGDASGMVRVWTSKGSVLVIVN
ncbi:MAG: WD40 repeat domain-containing protein [Limisphaerales bacterium]